MMMMMSVRDNQPSETRRLRSLHQTFCHPAAQIWTRLTTEIYEKCSSGSNKFTMSMNWSSAWSMSDIVSSKASLTTQLMSGARVSVRKYVWKKDLWAFNSTPIMHHMLFCISCLLILLTLSKGCCVKCSRISPVSFFTFFKVVQRHI